MNLKTYDLVTVGSGPAALSTAIEAKKRGFSVCMIDKESLLNTIKRYPTQATFFSTSDLLSLHNIPMITSGKQPTRMEAMKYYSQLVRHYDVPTSLHNEVVTIERQGHYFYVKGSRESFRAKNVVVATGYFDRFNALNDKVEEKGNVTHYYDEAFSYLGLKVLVVGASNSAAEAALDLYRHGVDVHLIHRGAGLYKKLKYWLKPDLENRIANHEIPAYFHSEIVDVQNGAAIVQQNGKEITLPCDRILALTGYYPNTDLLEKIGVTFDKDTLIPSFNPETLESNIPNIYLAGTVTSGRNTSKIFIENSRRHGFMILDDIEK